MNLALRPHNYDFINNAVPLLQRDLLYFEQVHLCSYAKPFILEDIKLLDETYYEFINSELDFLRSKHLVCDFNLSEMIQFTMEESGVKEGKLNREDTKDIIALTELFMGIPKPVFKASKRYPGDEKAKLIMDQYKKELDISEMETTRISALFLNRFAAKDQAFPMLFNHKLDGVAPMDNCDVLEVVLEKLPIPSEKFPWEKIIDFRADPESMHKFNALRVWMQDISRKDYSKQEIEERISYLMNEYEKHLQFHKMKYKRGRMKVLVTGTLETIENLVKFKWSKISETLFSLHDQKYDLLETEMKAPGKEIAYIIEANKKISNNI